MHATHIIGGDIEIVTLSSYQYQITLKVYRDCSPGTATDVNPTSVYIFDAYSNQILNIVSMVLTDINQINLGDACIPNPNPCVEEYIFKKTVTLFTFNPFYVTWKKCCRNDDILNIQSPLNCSATFYARCSPTFRVGYNQTPQFGDYPSKGYLCAGEHNYIDDFAITDWQGDSLVFSLENITDANTYSPFFNYCDWNSPANRFNVFGNTTLPAATIDKSTGVIHCWPPQIGTYVISVQVREFRNGRFIGEGMRDVQYTAVNCGAKQPYLNVSFSSYTGDKDLLEGCSVGTVQISRPDTIGDLLVDLKYTGTASILDDFVGGTPPSSIVIPAGQNQASFTLQAIEDNFSEVTETCTIYASIEERSCDLATSATDVFFIQPGYSFDVQAQNSGALCSGDSSTFSVTVVNPTQPNYDISWDDEQHVGSPVVFQGEYGENHTVVVYDDVGCFGTDTIQVDYSGHFFVESGEDRVACKQESVFLGGNPTAPFGGVYSWTPSNSLNDGTVSNPLANLDSSSWFHVTVTGPNGCQSSDSVWIEIFDVEMTPLQESEACPGSVHMLSTTSTSPISNIEWSWLGNTSNDSVVTFNAPATNTEFCFVAQSIEGCEIIGCDSLYVHGPPVFTMNLDSYSASCSGIRSVFIVDGDTNRIVNWRFQEDWVLPGEQRDLLLFDDSSTVELMVTDTNGCSYTQTSTYYFPGIETFYSKVIPNIFTPNNDGKNDTFRVEVNGDFEECSVFQIYNRWGQLLYEKEQSNYTWDGHNQKGNPVPSGTYFYTISIGDYKTSGALELIR